MIFSLVAVGLALLVAAPAVKRAIFKRADAEGFGGDPEKRLAAWQKATIVAFALREAGALIAMAMDWPRRGPHGAGSDSPAEVEVNAPQ